MIYKVLLETQNSFQFEQTSVKRVGDLSTSGREIQWADVNLTLKWIQQDPERRWGPESGRRFYLMLPLDFLLNSLLKPGSWKWFSS